MFIRQLLMFSAFVLAVSVTACGTSAPMYEPAPTATPAPAAPSSDAAPVPSAPSDAGVIETAVADSGTDTMDSSADTIVVDSSVDSFVADSGSSDSTPAPADTGAVDSGTDTSVADSGATDSGTADTSVTDTGVAPITGKLAISVLLPRWGATHSITVYGWSIPGKWTATGRGIDFTVDVVSGKKFTWNGFYDPKTTGDDWTYAFCDYVTMTPKVAAWATFNGKPTARVNVVSNSSGGCNLEFTAAASPLISSSDMDGDGFSPTDPDPAKRDCDDDPATGNRRFPWQIETPEDFVDLNCDGWNDPPRAVIRMKGVSSGASPLVYDVLHWGTTIAMTWDPASGSYQTPPLEMEVAPRVFFINWSGGGWDSSYESSVCKELTGGVLMFHDTDKTLIPVTLKVSSLGTSCHRFADF